MAELVLQTTYAELLQQVEAQAFADAFPEPGGFIAKTVKGRRYWYFQTGRGKDRMQRYVGPESPELLDRIHKHRLARDDARGRQTLVSTLVRSFAMPRALPQTGAAVAALARAGVFRLRGVLVGTVAFQTYPAMLGRRLAASALQTGDIDIAQFKEISVAVGEKIPPLLDVLRAVDPSFRAIPHPSERRKSVSYAAQNGLRVDVLTPNRGADSDAPQRLPALQSDAQPLRFLDFLIHQPVRAVLLHEDGVLVNVPAPERFAIHKLIVSRRRGGGSAKAGKDIRQAEALLEALATGRRYELADAWNEAIARGKAWRQLLIEGASGIAPVPRDALLKTIRWTRALLDGLDLGFPNPRPRYDFDRQAVVFTGVDPGGEMLCAISTDAMRDHFRGLTPGEALARFREHPSLFQALARGKYRAAPIEEPGIVLLRSEEIPQLMAATRP
ncbi:MAG TPA: GSU2403 family nucleotidyltransferase fold protein [Rhizomicrobium sp.]|nr:GSU2403 family nucleotidyltransferase fold protein [Rhizomicrobium sp.]